MGLRDHLCARAEFAPVAEQVVGIFVRQSLTYLQEHFAALEEVEGNRLTLSHLFWGHLVEARMAFGPLRFAACSCGRVMTGRDEEDLYGLVRRHLWGQQEPERHQRAALPETVLRRRLVGDQDRWVASSSSAWTTLLRSGSSASQLDVEVVRPSDRPATKTRAHGVLTA
jgi:hypothetical protein